ncbi:hypothetical protein DIJ64_08735 [Mycobacterium leprae]|uniref:Uncharacterized protein n=1 Tax=Mycobacterium leprae TaxID=1769 RepID=A0AAD0P8W7_MYCLR|nr:hypothetical protein DIJ64_08735 [Mycobacterium leprae]
MDTVGHRSGVDHRIRFQLYYCRADHSLIDVRLFKNRVVMLANSELVLLTVNLFNILLLISSYLLQQVERQTPTTVRCVLDSVGMRVG